MEVNTGIQLLLAEVSAIIKKNEVIQQKTGGYFNVFEIVNVSSDEVAMCRMIFELLNPKGNHFQGGSYLALFFKLVLNLDLSEEELKSAIVYREYVLDSRRRIDLVIETSNHFIPIEVKIYAGEQEAQCSDYYKKARNSPVFYLTLYGTPPSEYSAKGLSEDGEGGFIGIRTISFEHHILQWLAKCLELKNTITIAPIREILLQVISVFRKLTGQIEEGKEMEIKELLMQSGENMKHAFAIESSIRECKIELLTKLFESLDKKMMERGKSRVMIYDYQGDALARFYERGKTWPGLSYIVKSDLRPDTDLLFRIEIEDRLYAGYCIAYKKSNQGTTLSEEEVRQILPHVPVNFENGWWTYWEYLPVHSKGGTINFRYPENDENYTKLFDQGFFEEYISSCMKRIDILLGNERTEG